MAEAKQILADNPKDFTSLYYTMSFTRALAGNNPTPDVLDQGEKATTALLANIDTPPPNVTADKWKAARSPVEALGHSTLGWIAMQRKSWDAAEGEFQKSLQLDPNNGEVDYFMGTVIASEKNPQKMSAALFYFARAATYERNGRVGACRTPAGDGLREARLQGLSRQRRWLQRSADGRRKSQATPAADYRIKTAGEIALAQATGAREERRGGGGQPSRAGAVEEHQDAAHRADGANYFSSSMKDAQLPTLKGKVVKSGT